MRQFGSTERGSALWGKGPTDGRRRGLIATLLAVVALAAPSAAFADDSTDAFLADVYADTYMTDTSTSDVSWTDVSWTDVSWTDVSWTDVSWSDVVSWTD